MLLTVYHRFNFVIMFDILIGRCTLSNKYFVANMSITSGDYHGLDFVSNCMKSPADQRKQIYQNVRSSFTCIYITKFVVY